MGDPGIRWVCSRCGATLPAHEALKAHTTEHDDHDAKSVPKQDSPTPEMSASESQPPREPGRAEESTGGPARAEPSVPAGAAGVPTEESPRQPTASPPPLSQLTGPVVRADGTANDAATIQTDRRSRPSASRIWRWAAIAAVCVVAVGLGIAFPRQIAHQIALAVTKQPTPFTELYFSNPSGLPKSLSLSRPNVFGFTVVNHEGGDTAYSYVVTLASSTGSSTIAQGRVDLRSNEGATRLVDVRPTQRATEYLITVNLVGRTEMIRFRGVSQ